MIVVSRSEESVRARVKRYALTYKTLARARVRIDHRQRMMIAIVGHSRTAATMRSRAPLLIPNPIKKMAIQLKRQLRAPARSVGAQ